MTSNTSDHLPHDTQDKSSTFLHSYFYLPLYLELLPHSKKIRKLKTILAEYRDAISFKDSFQDLEDEEEDNQIILGFHYCIFTVEDKKQIVQLLKDYLIQIFELSDKKKSKKPLNWMALLEKTKPKDFSLFLAQYIPSYVKIFPIIIT